MSADRSRPRSTTAPRRRRTRRAPTSGSARRRRSRARRARASNRQQGQSPAPWRRRTADAVRRIEALVLLSTAAAAQPAPTFTAEVAPILAARCVGCHRAGGIGPFELVTYDDVKRHAGQIGVVTARRLMPPWKPAPG